LTCRFSALAPARSDQTQIGLIAGIGNAAGFRAIFPLALINVTLAPNDRLYVRWVDSKLAGTDDGLAIDDFAAGVANSSVTVVGPGGTNRAVATNPFGFCRIDNLQAGETYAFTVAGKSHRFAEPNHLVNIGDEVTGLDFVADPRLSTDAEAGAVTSA
jgi:hypothetical protein